MIFFSDQLAIKLCNGKSLIDYIWNSFDVEIIYLLRHPIPQSLSVIRKKWGYLGPINSYLNNNNFIKKYLNKEQVEYANFILHNGNILIKNVLNWILQNIIPLKSKNLLKWTTITYEELVLNTNQVINLLVDSYNLRNEELIYKISKRPSKNTTKNSKKKLKINNELDILKRWQSTVSNNEKEGINRLLKIFNIDYYNAFSYLPTKSLFEIKKEGK